MQRTATTVSFSLANGWTVSIRQDQYGDQYMAAFIIKNGRTQAMRFGLAGEYETKLKNDDDVADYMHAISTFNGSLVDPVMVRAPEFLRAMVLDALCGDGPAQ